MSLYKLEKVSKFYQNQNKKNYALDNIDLEKVEAQFGKKK